MSTDVTRTRYVDPLIAALRARRVALGISQRGLAEMTGTDNGSIFKREVGIFSPDLVVLRTWATALGCDIVATLRGDAPTLAVETVRGVDPVVATLKARRRALGLSQRALAARLGLRYHRTIWRRETGRMVPGRLADLRAWAEALDCDLTLTVVRDWEVTDETVGIVSTTAAARSRVDRLSRVGRTAAEIAEELGVSTRTVFRHRRAKAGEVSACSAA